MTPISAVVFSPAMFSRRGRPRSSDRLLVEQCASLRAPKRSELVVSNDPISITATATWPDDSKLSQVIEITTTTLPTRGKRCWFLCPACHRRCGRLYMVEELVRELRCRICSRLDYDIQRRRGLRSQVFRMLRKWRITTSSSVARRGPTVNSIANSAPHSVES